MRESVNLTRKTTRKPDGRSYTYWVLRWFDRAGKQHGRTIGRVDKVSKRKAEKLRREKERELASYPGRRNISRAPELETFLENYYKARRAELAPGTLELHQQTGKYLKAFFGTAVRLDAISRYDARAFKTALANGDLAHVNKRKRDLTPETVDLHIRNARTMLNHALDDELIIFNPFDRLGASPSVKRDWHYVTSEEFAKLLDATRSTAWRLMLALARWAALRRGEALNVRWRNIDWANNRMTIISQADWNVKDKEPRVVPIVPELNEELLAGFAEAPEGEERVIPAGSVNVNNVWRDAGALCRRAGVPRYRKPLHTLRKSCITDWARLFPAHVVRQWAGHSDLETTDRYYLQVSEAEYEKASSMRLSEVVAQLVAQLPENGPNPEPNENAESSEPSASQALPETAGDGIRTHDVQLGKLAFYH
jgi:integrase